MSRHILTMDQLVLFQQHLAGEEREQSTIEKYIREIRFFQTWLTGRSCSTLEKLLTRKRLSARDNQLQTLSSEQIFQFHRLGGVPYEVPENPAEAISRYGEGIDQSGVYKIAGNCE